MSTAIHKNCKDIWERDSGVSWTNLQYAKTGDEGSAVCYLEGSGSKKHTPKSIVYLYRSSFTDPSLWSVDGLNFKLVLGRHFKQSQQDFPKIKLYTGTKGNGTFIREVTAYKKVDNYYDFDSYTIRYDLGTLTPEQTNKGIMIKLIWGKTKTAKKSTPNINRASLTVDYHFKRSKIALYSSVNPSSPNTKDGTVWTLTCKNTGDCDNPRFNINIPAGAKVTDLGGGGSYSNGVWTVGNICKDGTVTRKFRIIYPYEGIYTLNACRVIDQKFINDHLQWIDLSDPDWRKVFEVCATSMVNVTNPPMTEGVNYILEKAYVNEESFFTLHINSEGNGHKYRCYQIRLPYVIENDDIKSTFEVIRTSNVENINREDSISYDYGRQTIEIQVPNNMVCIRVANPNARFEAVMRIPYKAVHEGEGIISTYSSIGKDYDKELMVFPKRKVFINAVSDISMDKSFVPVSVNIGSPECWSFGCRNSRHNFFREKESDLIISIEHLIPYIGCIPLSRAHKADVTSDVTNTLIDTRYLNRRYVGKEGNYLEKISMTLRMPWQNVATLKGLLEMDKPIPIDTCPELPDGDPLNHRGWAELSEIKNIKKINDMLYQCEPTVDYITHKLLTKFSIQQKDKLTNSKIDYFLSETHSYNDDMLERFNPSYYQFWTTLEDDIGNYIGSYIIHAESNLTLNSNDKLNDYCNYDIRFRNELPALGSEDYDNNWEMSFRVLNKDTRQILFEHMYNNFQHYDTPNDRVLNVADVTSRLWDGQSFETLNFGKISLGYEDMALLLEDRKTSTHFNSLDDTVFDADNKQFEVFLLDADNKGMPNQRVDVRVTGDDGYVNRFSLLTDTFGRVIFPMGFGNGSYSLTLTYDGDENYRPCDYSTDATIVYQEVEMHFEYSNNVIVNDVGQTYSFIVLDNNDDAVENIMIHYSFRDIGSDSYGYERTATSDSNGKITIPMDWTNGTKMLKVELKEFKYGGNIYQPIKFEQEININILKDKSIKLEADNIELVQGYKVTDYYVKVTDEQGNPLAKDLTFGIYNKQESYVITSASNAQGVASIPLYLAGDVWGIDVHFQGDGAYNPSIVSRTVHVRKFERLGSRITSENLIINADEVSQSGVKKYKLTLNDSYGNAIVNEPVSIIVKEAGEDDPETYVDMVLRTDESGIIQVPFISYDENVQIISTYHGCARYDGCTNSDIVVFEDIEPRSQYQMRFYNNKLQYKIGNGAWQDISGSDAEVDLSAIVINYENDNRTMHMGGYYLDSMKNGTYKVTLCYEGASQYELEPLYPFCKTLSYIKTNDTRKTLADWIEHTGGYVHEDFTISSYDSEDYAHVRLELDYEIPYEVTILELSNNDSYKTVPRYVNNGLYNKTILEYDIINPPKASLANNYSFYQEENDYLSPNNGFRYGADIILNENSNENVTLSQYGFAYQSQIYQNVQVSATSANADNHERVNEYYIMKLFNADTLEEFYYYSYLIDNVTVSRIEYLLSLGTWELTIVSKGTDSYNGAYYLTTATLTADSKYVAVDDFFYNENNWYLFENMNDDPTMMDMFDTTIEFMYGQLGMILSDTFTKANKFKLAFDADFGGNSIRPRDPPDLGSGYILFANPNESPQYWGSEVSISDGIIIQYQRIREYKNGGMVNESWFDCSRECSFMIERDGEAISIYCDGRLLYSTTSNYDYNTLGMFSTENTYTRISNIETYYDPVSEITPAVQDWDGTIFGSDIDLSLKKNLLNLIDYGMLPEGEHGSAKVMLNNVKLVDANYELEININYRNSRFERLNDLEGKIQARIYEDVSVSDSSTKYSKLVCSPVPVQNSITEFTRLTDEGRMYFLTSSKKDAEYLCNPYIQYKGGVNLTSETGIGLFNLDNGYSPVYLSNGLVRAEFHRYGGYVKVSRFDEKTQYWYTCQIFHLHDESNLELVENYSDDKGTVRFGNTKWTMWRGRPLIRLENPNDDLRMLNLVDRVYCETIYNEFNMGYVEEHDTTYSIFNPRMSVQLFSEELHIGEDMLLDNFSLSLVDGLYNEYYDADVDASMRIVSVENENALEVSMNNDDKAAIIFPDDSNYLRKPGDIFTLGIEYMVQEGITSMHVKARGYGDNGKIKENENHQFGLWEDVIEMELANDGERDYVRAIFHDVPSEVKYIDFMVILKGAGGTFTMKNLILYEGDGDENPVAWDIDRSLVNALNVPLEFTETYYACLYDEDKPCGLGIIRPGKEGFTLRTLTESSETVLVPYMKDYAEHDAVERIFLEYLNSKDQIVNVKWRD